jgi:hypothetical protein
MSVLCKSVLYKFLALFKLKFCLNITNTPSYPSFPSSYPSPLLLPTRPHSSSYPSFSFFLPIGTVKINTTTILNTCLLSKILVFFCFFSVLLLQENLTNMEKYSRSTKWDCGSNLYDIWVKLILMLWLTHQEHIPCLITPQHTRPSLFFSCPLSTHPL